MSRAQITLKDGRDKALAKLWIDKAKLGTRIEFKGPRRTIPQNDRMWAMLTDVARQHRIHGHSYTADDWKVMFLVAFAEEERLEIRHLPAIHRRGLIPVGRSSSDLSAAQMTRFIEWIFAWGAENGTVWSDPKIKQEREAA